MAVLGRLSTSPGSRCGRALTVLALLAATFTVADLPGSLIGAVSTAVAAGSCDSSTLAPPDYTTLSPGQAKKLLHDAGSADVPADAVSSDTTIEADSLCASNLPPLDEGMTDVTAGSRDGYRFLPHMTFNDDLHVTLPYDATLIPPGLSNQDVQIYYYDTTQNQWVPLQRDALDPTNGLVQSRSNHFTDMVAATVTVPDHPDNVNFDPTSIKDLKAADPSAGVDLVQPPGGNSQGDARMTYPIDLPHGRQGMAPSLQLSYSSAAGNGWLGVGWDLSVPGIGIDTRWGVPRYDPANETETYLMGDAQLTPLANRGTPQPRVAEKTFHTRIEGAFDTIVRHGNAPTNYWWEVTDKDGTRSFYAAIRRAGRWPPPGWQTTMATSSGGRCGRPAT